MYKANHDPANDVVFRQLESFYIAYENWAARRRTPAGDFAGFLDDVSSKLSRAPAKRERALELARRWRRRFVIEQIFLLFVIATVAAAASDIFLFILFFIGSTFQILLPSLAPGELFFNTFPKIPLPQMTIPIIAFGLVYLIWTTRYYLSTFWADVMFWTTQEEKDSRFAKRRDILRAATRALTHVLRDDNCQRIVVIGHSLGSAIAYETLLRLGRRLIARRGKTEIPIELSRLDIISHLVTIGSPIDWIHYFFELHDSRFHRYNRIHDVLKGSTDDPPFTVDRAPATQWINIWDDSDAISSELFSPRGRTPNSVAILDVWSPSSHWAGPVKAHSAYYLCTKSIKILFWIALFGRVPSGSDAIAPLTVIENFIFNYIRPGARIVGGCIVWAALICGSIFLFSDVSWRILLIPTVFIILLLMIRGFSSIADYQWPKQFGKILD
jgi:pimeloyl-ACP methyl ester carboxylesterase